MLCASRPISISQRKRSTCRWRMSERCSSRKWGDRRASSEIRAPAPLLTPARPVEPCSGSKVHRSGSADTIGFVMLGLIFDRCQHWAGPGLTLVPLCSAHHYELRRFSCEASQVRFPTFLTDLPHAVVLL